jgi:hypothetical protein
LLAPGYVLPRAYWGGTHDPLQILFALALNVIFYAVVVYFGLAVLRRWRPRAQAD